MIDPLWILAAGMLVVVGGILGLRLHAFLALLLGALVVGVLTPRTAIEAHAISKGRTGLQAAADAKAPVGARIAKEFGGTVTNIGILIAMAAIIGKCLLDSGAADRIVRTALMRLGERYAPAGFLGSGFMLGIPVFADTVFYLLIPLAKALAARTARNYTLLILAIVAGTTMSHSLVPPTPGPLLVASMLNVNVGYMIVAGFVIGLAAALAGFAYACWANRRWPIPVRESTDVTLADLQRQAQVAEHELPPLWLAWLPILLPLVLISGDAVLSAVAASSTGSAPLSLLTNFFHRLNEAAARRREGRFDGLALMGLGVCHSFDWPGGFMMSGTRPRIRATGSPDRNLHSSSVWIKKRNTVSNPKSLLRRPAPAAPGRTLGPALLELRPQTQ